METAQGINNRVQETYEIAISLSLKHRVFMHVLRPDQVFMTQIVWTNGDLVALKVERVPSESGQMFRATAEVVELTKPEQKRARELTDQHFKGR